MAVTSSTCGGCVPCCEAELTEPAAEELLNRLMASTPSANEPRRYWEARLHCEIAAFPRLPPNLLLPSREARFYWHLYAAAAKHLHFYQKDVNHALLVTLAKIGRKRTNEHSVRISDLLLRLKTYDYIGRKSLVDQLERLICKQTTLESICLEGLSLTPAEGVRLVLALYNSRKTMKYVYCWRAFEKMETPLVAGAGHSAGPRFYPDEKIKNCDWFRAIGCLEYLTTLSVNYAYIATPTGDLLVNLSKKLGAHWQWLQLLCLEEEIPENNCDMKRVGNAIPDDAWKEAQYWAPDLKVQYAIVGVPEYDQHKKFLARNTPTHTFALSTNIDLQFRHPRFLDCTIKTLCKWYPNTLGGMPCDFSQVRYPQVELPAIVGAWRRLFSVTRHEKYEVALKKKLEPNFRMNKRAEKKKSK